MPEDAPETDAPPGSGAPGPSDLSMRLISGIVLAALVVAVLYAGSLPFGALLLVVALVVSWEWARIVRRSDFDLGLLVHAAAVAVALCLGAMGLAGLAVAAIGAGTILVGLLTAGERPMLSAAGVVYAGLPAVALLWLRTDAPDGLLAVLFVLTAVAATDTGGYIFGRSIGGPKLAPLISPNKTWAGLIGGVAAGAAASAVFAHYSSAPVMPLVITGTTLGVVSQAGDLTESALKRAFGVKDASALIPGHGGVMDRVDGLIFAAIAAALIALAINPHAPATALLYGT